MKTRTTATETRYANRAQLLFHQYRTATGNDLSEDEEQFLLWLSVRRNEVTPSTWRYYRAALSWEFDRRRNPTMAYEVRQIETAGCRPRTEAPTRLRNTSARKQKSFPSKDRKALHASLRKSPSQYASAVRLMIEAGRIAGLRPVEWATARMDTGPQREDLLIVRNAKHGNERAHGEYRTLHLSALRKEEIVLIIRMIQLAKGHESHWDNFYHACRKLLTNHANKLWPSRAKRPTLYSARHQFAADAKAAGLTKAEVAALMGHGADRTATEHYGRKRFGWRGGFRVAPDPGDVQRVRETAKTRPQPSLQPRKPGSAPEQAGQ